MSWFHRGDPIGGPFRIPEGALKLPPPSRKSNPSPAVRLNTNELRSYLGVARDHLAEIGLVPPTDGSWERPKPVSDEYAVDQLAKCVRSLMHAVEMMAYEQYGVEGRPTPPAEDVYGEVLVR